MIGHMEALPTTTAVDRACGVRYCNMAGTNVVWAVNRGCREGGRAKGPTRPFSCLEVAVGLPIGLQQDC